MSGACVILALGCSGASDDNVPGPTANDATIQSSSPLPEPLPAAATTTPAITRHVILAEAGTGYPIPKLSRLLQFYPIAVIGEVEQTLVPIDPRPGYLGLSTGEIQDLQSKAGGSPIPSDALARPPGNMTSIYSIKVLESIVGDKFAAGQHFALLQPGGVFEGVAYENDGDPAILVGSTYIFFVAPFQSSNFQLPKDYDQFGQDYQQIYYSSAPARFIVEDGETKAVNPTWDGTCPECETNSLVGRPVDEAVSLVRDAHAGKPIPAPQPVTPAPTTPPNLIADVAIDGDPKGNQANALDGRQACVALAEGGTATVDLTVRGVPRFDSDSYSKGIAGFSVTFKFDPAKLQIVGVNPDGDSNTILAADGDRLAFDVIDTDGNPEPPAAPLPADKGYLKLDMLDISQKYEHGDGVLARLVVRGIGKGSTDISISDAQIFDASANSYDVQSVLGATARIGESCP